MAEGFIRIDRMARFDAGTAFKADLAEGDHLFVGINCFEPGQAQRVHSHAGEDKMYYVVSGRARMSVGDEERGVESGTVVWAPAGVPHGVTEALERTVMLVAMSRR